MRIVIAIGRTVDLAKGIIDDTKVFVLPIFPDYAGGQSDHDIHGEISSRAHPGSNFEWDVLGWSLDFSILLDETTWIEDFRLIPITFISHHLVHVAINIGLRGDAESINLNWVMNLQGE